MWDMGCDHGHLGLLGLKAQKFSKIHFVDSAISATNTLVNKICDYDSESFCVHHIDMGKVPGDQVSGEVVFSGLGGKTIEKALASLLESGLDLNRVDLVISAQSLLDDLRVFLRQAGLKLKAEYLVCENSQYFEVWHLSMDGDYPIKELGSLLWSSCDISVSTGHLQKILAPYRIKQDHGHQDLNKDLRISEIEEILQSSS